VPHASPEWRAARIWGESVRPIAAPLSGYNKGLVLPHIRRSRRYATLVIAVAWTLFGVYSGLQTHYRSTLWGRPYGFWPSLRLEVLYTTIWALLTPLILFLARRFPLPSPNWFRNFLVHITAMFAFAAGTKLIWDFTARPPGSVYQKEGVNPTAILKSVTSALDSGTMLYWVTLLSSYAYSYYRRFEKERLQASELQRQFSNAQLQALKMQLHPHFLFNALHTISGLVRPDPDAAERMIARLSDFLRISLEDSAVQQVELREELRFLNLYLDIERVRFDERLDVVFDIEPGTEHALVPNLILQPLVENSIRHGISQRLSGGRIVISARRPDGTLVLSVADNGPGVELADLSPRREGVGLSNTRSRLRRMYGDRQQIALVRPAEGGLEVRIVIPYETFSDSARQLVESHARPHSG
jgi:signal transduction histidine kinase